LTWYGRQIGFASRRLCRARTSETRATGGGFAADPFPQRIALSALRPAHIIFLTLPRRKRFSIFLGLNLDQATNALFQKQFLLLSNLESGLILGRK